MRSNSSCGACGAPAVTSWSRRATAEEVARFVTDPQVPSVGAADTPDTVVVAVLACAEHGFPHDDDGRPDDRAAIVHDPDCDAPPPDACRCAVPA